MKRKIIVLILALSLCLTAGGLYITRSIDRVIVKLESIITLHRVEILRKTLLTDVKAVQQDLLLKDSPHATDVDAFVQHGEKMAKEVDSCFSCHHDPSTRGLLEDLNREVRIYQKALSSVYTIRANQQRVNQERQIAFHIGQHLIREINEIIQISSAELAERTRDATSSISRTRHLLTLLVVLGPAVALAIAIFFIRDFTGSVETLLTATRKLKTGDLEHKIHGLRDEFGELGDSFNEMAMALKEMIRMIEENQKRYRMLFESAGDGIFILEAEGNEVGRIVSANKAAIDMHGYTADELLRLNIRDLESPGAAEESSNRILRILKGEWISAESSHQRKDGTIFPVEVSAGLLEFEDQKYILVFDKDITERKETEQALQRAEQLATVGEMAAGLAHEIKNPLAGIKLSIEVLANELEPEPQDAEVFRHVIGEINRIEILLKNLLDYARPRSSQFSPVDVNRIIEAAIKAAEFSLKRPAPNSQPQGTAKIEFVKNLNHQLPKVVADSAQLQQVILNLFLNAIHAIQDTGTISVETSAEANDFIRIVVSDTGKGIDGADIDRIFHPFFTTKPKGTGLGLSICKRLVEQQNGTIDVVRNPNGGLMFTIVLPIEQEAGVPLQ